MELNPSALQYRVVPVPQSARCYPLVVGQSRNEPLQLPDVVEHTLVVLGEMRRAVLLEYACQGVSTFCIWRVAGTISPEDGVGTIVASGQVRPV